MLKKRHDSKNDNPLRKSKLGRLQYIKYISWDITLDIVALFIFTIV